MAKVAKNLRLNNRSWTSGEIYYYCSAKETQDLGSQVQIRILVPLLSSYVWPGLVSFTFFESFNYEYICTGDHVDLCM